MSELDAYLVVGFFCVLCAFFIALGSEYIRRDDGIVRDGKTGPRLVFALCTCVGFGYYIAWLCYSHQPVLKLIPVFILSALVSRIPAGLGDDDMRAWLPATGIVLMAVTFHASRHLGII